MQGWKWMEECGASQMLLSFFFGRWRIKVSTRTFDGEATYRRDL